MPEVLFVKEIAKQMRMSPATVYKHIYRGDLQAEQYGTGQNSIRVSEEAFRDWRRRHTIGA
jgi:excisionase family DNA binding protein